MKENLSRFNFDKYDDDDLMYLSETFINKE